MEATVPFDGGHTLFSVLVDGTWHSLTAEGASTLDELQELIMDARCNTGFVIFKDTYDKEVRVDGDLIIMFKC